MNKLKRWVRKDRRKPRMRRGTWNLLEGRRGFESLEDRRLLATLTWVGNLDSFWDTQIGNETNWDTDTLPADGDTLIFPKDGDNQFTFNDTTDGNTYTLQFTGGSYTVLGNSISVGAGGILSSSSEATYIWSPLTLDANRDFTVSDPNSSLIIDSSIEGGEITKLGPGLLWFGSISDFDGTTTLTEGAVQADGVIGPVSLNGGLLQGYGETGSITSTADGGGVAPGGLQSGPPVFSLASPGNGPGVLDTGSISWNDATTFFVELQGSYPGAPDGYDQLNVTGNVNLNNAVLDVSLLAPPDFGIGHPTFRIINNDGVDPVVGHFQLADGTVLTEGAIFGLPTGEVLQISYVGGTGNDVTLTFVTPPIARNDFFVFPENAPTSDAFSQFDYMVSSPGVLRNDISPSLGGLSAVLVTGPTHGSLTLRGDGSFTYIPEVGYRGDDTGPGGINPPDDSFTYRATTGEVLTSDLTITASTPLPADLDIPIGTVIPAGELDPRFFSNLATVAIEINPVDAPPVSESDSYRVNATTATVASGTGDPGDPRVYEVTVAAPGVLSNDYSPQNTNTPAPTTPVTLSAILLSGPAHGTLVGGLNPDGSFVYRPNSGFLGVDSFVYQAVDASGLVGSATTVTLHVDKLGFLNPVAQADFYSTDRNTTLSIDKAGVLANDTDALGKLLIASLDGSLSNGELSAEARATLLSRALTASLETSPANGNVVLNPDGSFTYTPDHGFAGTDSFTYRAFDGTNFSSPTTVTINVRATNQKPIASDDTFTMQADDTLQVPAPGVLGNDSDPDGDALTASLVNSPQNGTLTLNADGSFTYVPNVQFTGTDSFTYRASDGTLSSDVATVTIHVQAIAPTTINIDPASDTGVSNTDGITNDNTPTFFGTAQPNLEVRLYSRPIGSNEAPVQVGQTTADSQGNWRITSSQVADGQHEFLAQAFRPSGQSTGQVLSFGLLTIDTVAPRVTSAFLSPKTGQVYITFQDDRSGMAQPNIGNTANYSFGRATTHAPRAFAVNTASVQPSSGPTAPQTVVLNVFSGRNLLAGAYLLSANSGPAMPDGQGGISDVAGNALDGVFDGHFPSGNGQPGSNFLARFMTNGRDLTQASSANQFVPYYPPIAANTPVPNIGFRLAQTRNGLVNGGQGRPQDRIPLQQLQRANRLAALQQARLARVNSAQLPAGPLGLQGRFI